MATTFADDADTCTTVAAQSTAFPEAFTVGEEYATRMVHTAAQITCSSQIQALGTSAQVNVAP